jgi:hypothetical protein
MRPRAGSAAHCLSAPRTGRITLLSALPERHHFLPDISGHETGCIIPQKATSVASGLAIALALTPLRL